MEHRAIRSVGLILVITLAAAPILRGQTPPKRTPEQIQASFAAHKGEFDYLLGDWEFTGTIFVLVGGGPVCRWRQDVDEELPAARGKAYRGAAIAAGSHDREGESRSGSAQAVAGIRR
jgi:hypothetical protein